MVLPASSLFSHTGSSSCLWLSGPSSTAATLPPALSSISCHCHPGAAALFRWICIGGAMRSTIAIGSLGRGKGGERGGGKVQVQMQMRVRVGTKKVVQACSSVQAGSGAICVCNFGARILPGHSILGDLCTSSAQAIQGDCLRIAYCSSPFGVRRRALIGGIGVVMSSPSWSNCASCGRSLQREVQLAALEKRPGTLIGDNFFKYTCSRCTGSGPVLERLPMSWFAGAGGLFIYC